MKKFYKISLGFGALLSSLTTVSAVVACGCTSKKKETPEKPIPKEPDVKRPGSGGPSGSGGAAAGGAGGGSGAPMPPTVPGQVRPNPPSGASGAQSGGETAPVSPPTINERPIIDPEIVPKVRIAELESMYRDVDSFSEKLKTLNVIPGNLDSESFLEMLKTRDGRSSVINGAIKKLSDPTQNSELNTNEIRGFTFIALVENFNDAVLIQNEEKLRTIHSFVGKVGPIIANENLIKDALNAFSFKVDENNELIISETDFVKPIYFVAKLLKSLPNDFTNPEIKLLFSVIPIFSEYRDSIETSDVIPELIRSDFLFNFGDLIESLMEGGLGNLDYSILKAHMISVAKVIDQSVDKTNPSSISHIANFAAKTPVIEVIGKLLKEGIFGLDENTVSTLKSINADLIPLLASKYPEARENIGLIISLIKVIERAISSEGIASLSKDEFEMILDELREANLVDPISAKERATLLKFLYDGFDSADDFADTMKGYIDESILAISVPLVIDVDEALTTLFKNLFEGIHTSDWSVVDALGLFDESGAQGISAIAQNGLLHANRDQFMKFSNAVVGLAKRSSEIAAKLRQYANIDFEQTGFMKLITEAPPALVDRWITILYGMLFRDIRIMSPIVRNALTPTTTEIKKSFNGDDGTALSLMLWILAEGIDNLVYEEASLLSKEVENAIVYYFKGSGKIRTEEAERATRDLVRHIVLGRRTIDDHRPPVVSAAREIYVN